MKDLTTDEIINAIRWKLDVAVDSKDYTNEWQRIAGDKRYREKLAMVSDILVECLQISIDQKLGLRFEKEAVLSTLTTSLRHWIKVDEPIRSPALTSWIMAGLNRKPGIVVNIIQGIAKVVQGQPPNQLNTSHGKSTPPVNKPPTQTSVAKSTPVHLSVSTQQSAKSPDADTSTKQSIVQSQIANANPNPTMPKNLKTEAPLPENTDPKPSPSSDSSPGENVRMLARAQITDSSMMTPQRSEAAPSVSLWQYHEIPDGPDNHIESYQKPGELFSGLKIVGARVRGKKHKHDATNCDDWFEFARCGPWTIVAVSDGAGSKKLSRVGARAAVDAAIAHLKQALSDKRISELVDLERDSETQLFVQPQLNCVQRVIYDAMHAAHRGIELAFSQRVDSPEYEQILGRKPQLNDFSATFLLALHYMVTDENTVVFACQVGDGITALVDGLGKLKLLGTPDSGKFSGETEFITDKHQLEIQKLATKTFVHYGPMRALMTMTDGVADPYFPADPGILRLYADLVLNRVVELRGPDAAEVQAALASGPTVDKFLTRVATVAPLPREVPLRSASIYASQLGMPVEQLAASPKLLIAGSMGEPGMCDEDNRLLFWLDSFYVRGEFDDRTLVMIYREVVQ